MGSLEMSFAPFLVRPDIKQQNPLTRICFLRYFFRTVLLNRPRDKKSPKIKQAKDSYDDIRKDFTTHGSFS
jgi:hypothetical protein